jgi:hypothetical protein
LENLKYAETVIEQAHSRTCRGELEWIAGRTWIEAKLTPEIEVSIKYKDDGPDSATWDKVMISHSVGRGLLWWETQHRLTCGTLNSSLAVRHLTG